MSMLTKGPSLLYGSDKGGDSTAASEFITRLLHGSTMLHMHHLMVTGPGSFAKHSALDVYNELASLTDDLAEAWMGCTGGTLSFQGGAMQIGTDCKADVQALYEYVESARAAMGSESHIQNEIDGICTLLSSVLFKLNRLA